MAEEISIRVFEVVNSGLCVASDDGEKVFSQISAALKSGRKVCLSFENVTSLTSAFLNAAIGQLYGKLSEEKIRENLRVEKMAPEDIPLLKRVVETAKAYFKDPERFSKARNEVLGGDDGD